MKIFVYGTLKSGFSANHYLSNSRLMGKAVTRPRYRIYSHGWFPMLNQVENGIGIHGEVWQVSPDDLRRIDCYEGPGFEKKPIELEVPFSQENVYAYFCIYNCRDMDDVGNEWK